ncbi:hypothetical protein CHS0354_026971 [Potamilus streckersoni]|uniref:Uncharacterized protein n=1 Tax=Potamilus streckersoni TaxID=2493646 RepID=A0AAE0SCE0_9BIVA|nr:hypothetical protein CHS0354_026971 [Potamilus streckersoni]
MVSMFGEGKNCKPSTKTMKKKVTRIPGPKEEKAAVERQLGQYIRTALLTGKAACEDAKRKEAILARRP